MITTHTLADAAEKLRKCGEEDMAEDLDKITKRMFTWECSGRIFEGLCVDRTRNRRKKED